MKAEELRIGNLVTLSGSLILTVYEIHEDCFYAKDAKGSSFKNTWADLQQIPLSEEVMLKCGFNENEFGFHKGMLSFLFRTDKKFIPNIFDICCLKEVKHLHQLQNLFYAITGEELEVSL